MKVLVDTPIWSLAFRRAAPVESPEIIQELKELINEQRVVLLGVVRQEVLSGIRDGHQFHLLRQRLRAFGDYPLGIDDFELAAEFFNRCRSKGIQGSNTDFLLCAVASRHHLSLFTTDKDFDLYSKHMKLQRHGIRPTSS